MQNDVLASLRQLSDAELVARLKTLTARERNATAQLVAHLAELDTRDLHLRVGYGSLFAYCTQALTLSEAEAYNRIEAARAARRFPVILELLATGAVHLTTVRLLAPHLTAENHQHVLESARGKRKAEVEEIVARLSPRPDAAASVRKLPTPRPVFPPPAPPLETVRPLPPVLPAPTPPAEAMPLSPGRYKLQVTIAGDTLEKLRLAKDLLRHAIPSGDDAAILDRALAALLADLARKKFAATEKPRPGRGPVPRSRQIPAAVRRAVWLRDLGRCAFVGTKGHHCNERGFLEFHHVRPYAAGGEATVGNIQLRCRQHNGYESRVYFGQERSVEPAGLVKEDRASYAVGVIAPQGLVLGRVRDAVSDQVWSLEQRSMATRSVGIQARRTPRIES
jgi:hypothetical protein